MVDTNIPIICSLNDEAFRERELVVLGKIKSAVLETSELPNGYAFRFAPDDDSFAMLNEFIVLERGCCPFLDFKMTVPRGSGDIQLELSGSQGAKEFIAAHFKP